MSLSEKPGSLALLSPETPEATTIKSSETGHNSVNRQTYDAGGASNKDQSSSPPSTRQITGIAWAVLVIGLVSANLLISMDNTIVADIQAPIIKDLGEIHKFPWISVGFALGAASANIFWGHLHRHFDTKILFLTAIAIFEAGSAVCGSAKQINVLIEGRIVCGLGGTGIFMGVMNSIFFLTTPAERPFYLSFPGAAWSIGAMIGPVIGGAINDSSGGWRWCFYINLVIGGVWLPVYLFLLPPMKKSGDASVMERFHRLDLLGLALWVGGLCCLVMAISFGGVLFAWSSGTTISLFVVSGALWTLLLMQQSWKILTSKEYRLIPFHLLSGDLGILVAQTASGITGLFLPLYFIPLYLQFIRSDSALMAGTHLLPFIVVLIFFMLLNGRFMGRTGRYIPWYLIGSALVVIGSGLMQTINVSTSTSMLYGFSAIMGAGAGAFIQASFIVVQTKVSASDIPIAVALVGAGQVVGAVLGSAVAYSVFLNTATSSIAPILPQTSTSSIQAAIAGHGAEAFDSLDLAAKNQVLEAVAGSLKNIWIQLSASGGFCFVLSLVMAQGMMRPRRTVHIRDNV